VIYPAKYEAGVARSVEIQSYCLRVDETALKLSDLLPKAKVEVTSETMIPKAEIMSG
jgi:hypothetical protein